MPHDGLSGKPAQMRGSGFMRCRRSYLPRSPSGHFDSSPKRVASHRKRDQPQFSYACAKTTNPLAGMVIAAEVENPCMGGPDATIPPPLPATTGFGKLS